MLVPEVDAAEASVRPRAASCSHAANTGMWNTRSGACGGASLGPPMSLIWTSTPKLRGGESERLGAASEPSAMAAASYWWSNEKRASDVAFQRMKGRVARSARRWSRISSLETASGGASPVTVDIIQYQSSFAPCAVANICPAASHFSRSARSSGVTSCCSTVLRSAPFHRAWFGTVVCIYLPGISTSTLCPISTRLRTTRST
mmetsp:Transcript_13484/g.32760  ORF Transcript_13484/g.32760 Transcript_13484/m.32760 type:complete len:203 (-) Transcript_13484:111-719(-)